MDHADPATAGLRKGLAPVAPEAAQAILADDQQKRQFSVLDPLHQDPENRTLAVQAVDLGQLRVHRDICVQAKGFQSLLLAFKIRLLCTAGYPTIAYKPIAQRRTGHSPQ